MNKTKQILQAMLTENTGRHMLDSGGSSRRNWQRNQDRIFEDQPRQTTEFSIWRKNEGEILITQSLYHFLYERLDFAESLDNQLREFDKTHDPDNRSTWGEILSDFVESLKDDHDINDVMTVNTYNGEDTLSQVIQYTQFTIDGDLKVILQIHGGADVRGGYTEPRIFEPSDSWNDYPLSDNAHCSLDCSECSAYWYTDDAHHWYFDGATGFQLDDLYWFERDNLDSDTLRDATLLRMGSPFVNLWTKRINSVIDFINTLHSRTRRTLKIKRSWDFKKIKALPYTTELRDDTLICPVCNEGVIQ